MSTTIKRTLGVALALGVGHAAQADTGVIAHEDGDCAVIYTNLGYAVVEWYGGFFMEGARVVGDINSYGMKELYYDSGSSLRVWVDDFWLSEDDAIETFYECTS